MPNQESEQLLGVYERALRNIQAILAPSPDGPKAPDWEALADAAYRIADVVLPSLIERVRERVKRLETASDR